MTWVWSNLPTIWDLAVAHMVISAIAIVVSFVVSIPFGYWASRSPVVRTVLLTVGNIFYTIPGIGLVVLIPVILGLPILTPRNLLFALTIYGLALMVRTAADAFTSVPDEVVASATAQGFSPWQRFARIELPLAGPVLLAGLRVVSVSTVSLATLGALIGIDTLGNLFVEGFQRAFYTELITGIVAVVLLAAVFDLVLNGIGRALMPWNRRGAVRRRRPRRPPAEREAVTA